MTRHFNSGNVSMKEFNFLVKFLFFSTFFSYTRGLSSGSSGDGKTDYTSLERASVRVTHNGQPINTTLTQTGHLNEISIELSLSSVTYILDLHINSQLFASSYHEKAVGANTTENVPVNHTRDHCHYIGDVRGSVDSIAAASVCTGVSGHFIVDKISYHIVPLGNSLLSDVSVFTAKDELRAGSCGQTATESPFLRKRHNKIRRDLNWPQDMDGVTKVVELYLVNDYFQFQARNQDFAAVTNRAKEAANIASSLYQPQNIYLVLVGMEVWTTGNKVEVLSSNLSYTLASFLKYRRTQIKTKNDNAQLITSLQFSGGVVGLAPIGLMCTVSQSGSVCSDVNVNVGAVASTMAHEMGHNFGLIHDGQTCKCTDQTGQCIMFPSSGGTRPALSWSDCSVSQFREAFNQGADFCLYNKPSTVYDNRALCGNGIVESGEACDCGKSPTSFCNPSCCNSTTCQLNPGSKCASGRCCDVDKCTLKHAGAVCRKVQRDCDLPEYCSGEGALCPFDVYMRDGTNCTASGVAAYCYAGKCNSHQSQCQLLWGSSVANGDSTCYTSNNYLGTLHANCGADWAGEGGPTYLPCDRKDTLCGKLHCNAQAVNLAHFKQFYLISEISMGSSIVCKSVIYELVGEGLQDPGLVPNGASCGDEMMCVNQKCVSVQSILAYIPPPGCPKNCSEHGVCNNLGQCHCDSEYGPPDCSGKGTGGSIHSNNLKSGKSHTGLIVGLIFLFLILIALGGVAAYLGCRNKDKISKAKQSVFDRVRALKLPVGKNRTSNPDTAPKPTRTVPKPTRAAPAPAHAAPVPVRAAPVPARAAPARAAPAPQRSTTGPLRSAPVPPRPGAEPPRPPVVPARPSAFPNVETDSAPYYSGHHDDRRFAPPMPPNKPPTRTVVASHDNSAYVHTEEPIRPVLPPKPRPNTTAPHSATAYTVGTSGYDASHA